MSLRGRMRIRHVLLVAGLDHHYSSFVRHNVRDEDLPFLDVLHIAQIIPDVGGQIHFKQILDANFPGRIAYFARVNHPQTGRSAAVATMTQTCETQPPTTTQPMTPSIAHSSKTAPRTGQSKAYSVDQLRQKHPKAYAKWTLEEDMLLETLKRRPTKELVTELKRSAGSIRSRIAQLRDPTHSACKRLFGFMEYFD